MTRNAGSVAMGASTMLSRVNTLVNVGYGEELDNDLRTEKSVASQVALLIVKQGQSPICEAVW